MRIKIQMKVCIFYRAEIRIMRPWGQYFVGALKISKKTLISGK